MEDLDEILKDEKSAEEVEETKEADTGEQNEEVKAKAETESDVEGDKPDDEKPSSETEEKKPGPDDAFIAMRKTMQEQQRALKSELAEVKAQLQAKDEGPAPDPIDDPEAFQKHMDERLDRKLFDERCNFSYEVMVDAKGQDDMSEKEEAFSDAMKADPSLQAQLLKSHHPAKFVYDTGKAHMERQNIGDPLEYGEKIREQALKEAEAKMEEKLAELRKEFQGANLPKSLADEQSSGGVKSPTDSGQMSLDELVGR